MTDQRIEKIREAAMMATQGPWLSIEKKDGENYSRGVFVPTEKAGMVDPIFSGSAAPENCAHIANCAPEVIVKMTSEVLRLREALRWYADNAGTTAMNYDLGEVAKRALINIE